MQYENIDFPEAVRRLASRAGIAIIEDELSAEEETKQSLRKRLLRLHFEVSCLVSQQFASHQGGGARTSLSEKPGNQYRDSQALADRLRAEYLGLAGPLGNRRGIL